MDTQWNKGYNWVRRELKRDVELLKAMSDNRAARNRGRIDNYGGLNNGND